ncbi:MAG: GSCFA domain-containing protein [Bacteroidota bacterium]
MQFHLGFKPKSSQQKLAHEHAVLMMGSCFSEHIGKRLSDLKFNVHSNPFGIIFNPKSIEMALQRIVTKQHFTEHDVFEKDWQWFCMEAHSSFSADTKVQLLNQLNAIINSWHEQLKQARYLIITFGSAYAYKHISAQQTVANCHKLPQSLFEKTLLETQSIVSDYQRLIQTLQQFNPNLHILFTVSPVKHLKDGVVENNLSKAVLIQTVHQLIKQNTQCDYFPAYELVNDDLRDYRFYEADMAHPNKQAIDYVWQKFSDTYFSELTATLNSKLNDIKQAFHHRLFKANSVSSITFKKTYYKKCIDLEKESPFLDLTNELNYFSL